MWRRESGHDGPERLMQLKTSNELDVNDRSVSHSDAHSLLTAKLFLYWNFSIHAIHQSVGRLTGRIGSYSALHCLRSLATVHSSSVVSDMLVSSWWCVSSSSYTRPSPGLWPGRVSTARRSALVHLYRQPAGVTKDRCATTEKTDLTNLVGHRCIGSKVIPADTKNMSLTWNPSFTNVKGQTR